MTTTPVTTPIVSTGVPGISSSVSTAPTTGGGGTTTSNASVATTFDPNPVATSGGGLLEDVSSAMENAAQFVGKGLKGLIGVAAGSMTDAQRGLQDILNKAKESGQPPDAAEVALCQSKISEATMCMEMLAKAFEEDRRASQVWLRG